ncbi:MAG: RING finger protein [Candidatus Hadarchaeum sp.]|nr:hypothetical protein [candidate division KSB1 bacterium]
MPFLLYKENSEWRRVKIDGILRVRIAGGKPEFHSGSCLQSDNSPGFSLCVYRDGMRSRFALISKERMFVNAGAVAGGIAVLRDRDELRINGHTFFFSAEAVPEVQLASTAEKSIPCPICGDTISEGQRVVRCPRCFTVYHQDEERARPCWASLEKCATFGCEFPTKVDATALWIPEE